VTRIVLATLAALLALTGCASGSQAESAGNPPEPATVTAEHVMAQLAQRVPTASLTLVYTADNDPNDLLGRPGGYTSKVAFADSRILPEETDGLPEAAIERGGSVEVFADEQGARKRMEYIQAIAAGLPLATEYDYVSGQILVRVSRELIPDQALEYERALAEID
jgi:hypothetical protein